MSQAGSKPYDISKQVVAAAFEKVAKNKGAPGVDGVTVEQFAQDYKNNLYKVWNRMSSGSYFPSPVRMVEIPKEHGGGTRVLGVPTVADRTAQAVAVAYLEPRVEPVFHPDSYGFRPGRSQHDAIETCRARCFRYDWVLDLDIEKFFDNVDHDLVLKAVAHHADEQWILLYVQRWLKVPMHGRDGSVVVRDRGTPQGAVISPLLANLFLHYTFDAWMAREFPHVPFERYVDDVIVHCVSEQQARRLREAIAQRLEECGGLRLHPTKTRIVYCKTSRRYGRHDRVSFDFLGFTFKPRSAKAKDGTISTTFTPAISTDSAASIRAQIRDLRLHRRTTLTFEELAKVINPLASSWMAYYGKFNPWATLNVLYHIDRYLVRWARRKFKHLRRAPARAYRTLAKIKRSRPGLFAHWRAAVTIRVQTARAG